MFILCFILLFIPLAGPQSSVRFLIPVWQLNKSQKNYYQNMGENEFFRLKIFYLLVFYECLCQPFHNLGIYSMTWSILILPTQKNLVGYISKE